MAFKFTSKINNLLLFYFIFNNIKIKKNLGDKPTDDKIKEFIMHEISDKRKIPGYMSDELSHIDPRFLHQKAFAERYIKSEPLIYLMKRLYRVTPGLLRTINKTVNPWPNVEASCGALLHCFGIREPEYFSTIFGVSRSIGVCSNMILAKAFGNYYFNFLILLFFILNRITH